jgi:fluoroquinolone transport system ATP-binding protein
MISVQQLSFSYTNNPFIENINFNVAKGEIFGFLGPSGAGKSTLQKILTGLITGYSGVAAVMGLKLKNIRIIFMKTLVSTLNFQVYLKN